MARVARALEIANPVAGVLALACAMPAILFVLLSQLGQSRDLARASVTDNLFVHMFFTSALVSSGVTSWALVQDTLNRHHLPTSRPLQIAIAAIPGFAVMAVLWLAYRQSLFAPPAEEHAGFSAAFAGLVAFVAMAATVVRYSTESAPSGIVLGTALVLSCFYLVPLALWPDTAGTLFGPLAILLFASATPVWLLWLLTRYPVLILPLVAVAYSARNAEFGTRDVRTIESTGYQRVALRQYAGTWIAARRKAIGGGTERYPVYLVTSDGGGIRSSIWTAGVLAALSRRSDRFDDHIFALSGVSGGAVGTSIYAGLLREKGTGFDSVTTEIFGPNLLSAPLARLLLRDPFESTVCLGWKWCGTSGDRAISLEQSLESTWRKATGSPLMEQPFEQLWAPGAKRPVPLLFLNTTEAGSGMRRVVSPVILETNPDEDVLGLMPRGTSLRLSTASILSARFPLISPQGRLRLGEREEHLVDGGYFDNSGSATALQAFHALRAEAEAAGVLAKMRFVAIILTNDPARPLERFAAEACNGRPANRPEPEPMGLLQPVGTLDATRAYAAENWRRGYRAAIEQAGGSVEVLALHDCDGDLEEPLGWTLSRQVRAQMNGKIKRIVELAAPGLLRGVRAGP